MTSRASTKTLVRPAVVRPLAIAVTVPATGARFRLSQKSCLLGSGSGADILIRDETASRKHVELTLVPEGVLVQDLGSRNGTFYLGNRIEKAVLAPGNAILVGRTEVRIDLDASSFEALEPSTGPDYRGIVGRSEPMRQLFAVLQRIEGSLVNVLVSGESGTGKEVVANAIHRGSRVAEGPFVALNCGGLAREVIASELFGHKRGAFTGAIENRRGAFEAADGGTLFLDEVGELPGDLQPMLLRVLETGEVRPVGSDQTKKVRVRVIAATNRDLSAEIKKGTFREDLFYRLSVLQVELPPLRARTDDIEPLAQHFAKEADMPPLPANVIAELRVRALPGNARELKNVVLAYGALGALPKGAPRNATLESALSEMLNLDAPYPEQKDALVDLFTTMYLKGVLAKTNGNQTAAAKIAGIDRSYFGKLVARLLGSG